MAARMKVNRGQALAWRLRRQYLVDGADSAEQVVRRLGATVTWSGDPEVAVGRRLHAPMRGAVAHALEEGRLIRTWSFRGAVHLMEPESAVKYLVVRCAGRQWELPSWVGYYQLEPSDWPALREAVRDALRDGPLTPPQLGTVLAIQPRFRHLEAFVDAGNTTLLKPLAWHGDLVLGTDGEGRLTLQAAPAILQDRPPLEEAGRAAVIDYLDAYGPASSAHLYYWLGEGLGAGRRRVAQWIDGVAGELVDVDVGGEPRVHLQRHAADLESAPQAEGVLLLPGHDQWVIGPGTADPWIIDPGNRRAASRGAPLAVVDGRACGTWKVHDDEVVVARLPGEEPVPKAGLDAETSRLSRILGRPLTVSPDDS